MAICANATDCASAANESVRNAATEAVDLAAVHLWADNDRRAVLHPHDLRDRRVRSLQSCSPPGCTSSCSPCGAIGLDPSPRPRSASCPNNRWWCWRAPSSSRCRSRVAFQRVMRDLLCGQLSAACPCAVLDSVRRACATPSRDFGFLSLWQLCICIYIARQIYVCMYSGFNVYYPQSVRVWFTVSDSVWRTRQHTLPFQKHTQQAANILQLNIETCKESIRNG